MESYLPPQPGPSFSDHNRVPRVMWVVLHRRGQTQAAGEDVDEMPQVGDVLRGLVLHPRDVIVIEKQLHRDGRFAGDFLNVGDGSVDDATRAREPLPSLALQVNVSL